ncbi:MAG: hypothetical protein RIQ56_969 [Candidatus Parcubacteria bacterium]|jgi:cytochrome o ubiquinol oxidase subunit 3
MNTHAHSSHERGVTNIFGVWVYILSDCLLFASLFATYAVLKDNVFGGPSAKDLFDLNYVFFETIILLTSSFTCGLALLSAHKGARSQTLTWLSVTAALGALFLFLEVREFVQLLAEGHSWTTSAFLSAFFALVGTHGLHVLGGIIFMLTLMIQIALHGVTGRSESRLASLALFWHFLDIVWIFIFTFVYLLGAM